MQDYKIITYRRNPACETKEQAAESFEKLVKEYLALGWKISGGIVVDSQLFLQAVYYELEEKKEEVKNTSNEEKD